MINAISSELTLITFSGLNRYSIPSVISSGFVVRVRIVAIKTIVINLKKTNKLVSSPLSKIFSSYV